MSNGASSITEWLNTWGTDGAAVIAAGAFVVAVVSYLETASAARRAHMHDLFRGYLEDRGAGLGENPRDTETPVSIRLYVLEEMHAWTEDELKITAWWPPPYRQRRREVVQAWRETILVHAGYDFVEVVDNLCDYRQCYGLKFLQFIDVELTPKRVLSSISGRHFRTGHELELGSRKLDQLLKEIVQADNDLASMVVSEVARRKGRFTPHCPPEVEKLSARIEALQAER